jgi:hypothetical protein
MYVDVKIAALVISESLGYYVPYGFDVIGFGIWAGTFYFLAGCFGISTTYKRTKSRYIKLSIYVVVCINHDLNNNLV